MKTKYVFTVLSILLLLACFVGSVSALTEDTVSLTNSAKSIYLSTELSDADKSQQLSELCGWDARLALYTQAEMIENEETGEVTLNYNGLDTSGVTDLYDFYTGSQAYSEYLQNMNFVYENVITPAKANGSGASKAPSRMLLGSTRGVTGDGTASNPYVIYDGADLNTIASNWNTKPDYYGAYFKLDSSFPATSFTLTGNLGSSQHPFTGVFDGNGKIITAVMPDNGLFNVIGSSSVEKFVTTDDGSQISGYAVIYDLTFKDCTLDTSNNWVGLLCDHITTQNVEVVVYNVDISGGHVKSASYYVGGLCGVGSYGSTGVKSMVEFSHCDVNQLLVESTASDHVGGLCGIGAHTNANVEFYSCTVKNSVVKAASHSVGGLCGTGAPTNANIEVDGCTVENCRILSSASYYVGGLCGGGASTNANGDYRNSNVVKCTMSGTDWVGGIFGYIYQSTCTVTGCSVQNSCVLATSGKAYGISP